MCLVNYGDSEAVNLCRYVEKSTKCSELNAPVLFENTVKSVVVGASCVQVLSDLHTLIILRQL